MEAEAKAGGTFTMLAIGGQQEASSAGAAVGAQRVLTRVLAQAAWRGPALVHVCRGRRDSRHREVATKLAPSPQP
jgi:hypothetical protein